MVNIVVGSTGGTAVAFCAAGDANDNGVITIDEILSAVNAVLNGCVQLTPTVSATPRATRTPSPPVNTGMTFLSLNSERGDPIGIGIQQTLTSQDGAFAATHDSGHVEITIGHNWYLAFAAPRGLELTPGTYTDATDYPFQKANVPGLDVGGPGLRCSEVTGWFIVEEAAYAADGAVQRLAVDFEQHCDGRGAALYGVLRFNSDVPTPTPVPTPSNDSQFFTFNGQDTYTRADGVFTVRHNFGHVSVFFQSFDYSNHVSFDFAAPNHRELTVGTYEGATRYPFQKAGVPGLNVSGPTGCNELTGRFVVHDAVYTMDRSVTRFAVDFEQRCDRAADALYGAIRLSSEFPTPSPVPTSTATPTPTPTPVTFGGSCMVPGPSTGPSLVACADGVTVTVYRCDQRRQCLDTAAARTVVASETSSGDHFVITVDGNLVQPGDLILIASGVEEATSYRTLVSIPRVTLRAGNPLAPILIGIDPGSEAAVRWLATLPQAFDDDGIQAVIFAVRTVSTDLNFSGLSLEGAVDAAALRAEQDAGVRKVVTLRRGVKVVAAAEPVGVVTRIPDGPVVGGAPHMPAQFRVTMPDEVRVETLVTGLEVPWSLAFAPDRRLFVSERPGRIRIVRNGILDPTPWATLPVYTENEGGLMGLALDPNFGSEPWVYVCYTFKDAGTSENRISRFPEVAGHAGTEEILLDHFPGAVFHNGCRLKFGPDGKLYATTGDATQSSLAQDLSSLAGKILRLNRDGTTPADNPFGSNSPVYSYGHRNPQDLAFEPQTGSLFATEHGPSGEFATLSSNGLWDHDEVNIIVPGGNYGWPLAIGAPGLPEFHDPLIAYVDDSLGVPPAGAAFYSSSRISQWTGDLLFASLRSQHLQRIVLDATRRHVLAIERLFEQDFDFGLYGRLRDIIEGPDGAVYFSTSNRDGRATPEPDADRILRILPAVDQRSSPSASLR